MSLDHAKEYARHAKRDSRCLVWVFILIVLTWIGIPIYGYVMNALMSEAYLQQPPPPESPDSKPDSN